MDKFDFLEIVADAYKGLETEEQIEAKTKEMIKLIMSQNTLSKGYLQAGIL